MLCNYLPAWGANAVVHPLNNARKHIHTFTKTPRNTKAPVLCFIWNMFNMLFNVPGSLPPAVWLKVSLCVFPKKTKRSNWVMLCGSPGEIFCVLSPLRAQRSHFGVWASGPKPAVRPVGVFFFGCAFLWLEERAGSCSSNHRGLINSPSPPYSHLPPASPSTHPASKKKKKSQTQEQIGFKGERKTQGP